MIQNRKINCIILHHTADETLTSQYDKINVYHKDVKKFPLGGFGSYVGYHVLIEFNGDIIFCRPFEEVGAHDAGENADSVGVALAGNFNTQQPSDMQILSFSKVCDIIFTMIEKQVPIEPHRKGDTTECPGKNIPDNWGTKIYLKQKINWLTQLANYLKTELGIV